MAYALVGTIGAAVQGTSGAAVSTLAWGAGESRTAGNLLICFCSVTGANGTPSTPSGWSATSQSLPGNSSASIIFYKIAAGADAAPTLAAVTSGVIAAQLAEFSGNSATPLDKTGTGSGTTSPVTATFGAADTISGELILMASADFRSAARAPNDTWTSNHATVTQAGNNNAVSVANHYSFGYALATTSNSGANTAVMTASVTTSITGLCVSAATFKLGATVTQQPLTATLSCTAALNKRINDGGFVATLSFAGAFARSRLFLKSFAATLFQTSLFPSSGLVSYWKLDEASGTRVDSFGSNHLADNNTVGSATGIQGNAATFVSASTQYLSCASNSSLQMSGNTDFTISAWIKFTSLPAFGGAYGLITKDTGVTNSRDYTLDYTTDGTGSGARFYIKGGATFLAGTTGAASTGVWYFVVAWYDSSNGQVHLRINDTVTQNSLTGATGTDVSSSTFCIGARADPAYYLDGTIDEVGIWKRLLTPTEISALYNGGAGLTYTAGGPVATLTRKPLKVFAATFAPVAALSRQTAKSLTATLSFVGAFGKRLPQAFSATLSFVGFNNRTFKFARTTLRASLFFNAIDGYRGDPIQITQIPLRSTGNFSTGQCFVAKTGTLIGSRFWLNKQASPTGNVTSSLYALTGTFGSTAIPTGSALAVSDPIDVTTLPGSATTAGWTYFTFSGSNRYSLTTGTQYFIIVDFSGGDGVNFVNVYADISAFAYHPGNNARFNSGAWSTQAVDVPFSVYAAPVLVKSTLKSLSGILSFLGDLATSFIAGGGHVFTQSYTATLSFSGAITRRTGKALAAVLSFAGAFTKLIRNAGFSATLSFVGFLATSKAFLKSFAATLSFTGLLTVSKSFLKTFTATLSFTGTLGRRAGKAFSAILSSSASFVRRVARTFSATLTSAGTLVKVIRDAGFTATLSFVGTLGTAAVHFFTKAFTATLSFVGVISTSRRFARALTATLSFTGAIRRRVGKSLAATLVFSVALRKAIRKSLTAVLSFVAFFFKGGAVEIIAGLVTKCGAFIGIGGSTASIAKAGSQLDVVERGSGAKIQVAGSTLRVERTK